MFQVSNFYGHLAIICYNTSEFGCKIFDENQDMGLTCVFFPDFLQQHFVKQIPSSMTFNPRVNSLLFIFECNCDL